MNGVNGQMPVSKGSALISLCSIDSDDRQQAVGNLSGGLLHLYRNVILSLFSIYSTIKLMHDFKEENLR